MYNYFTKLAQERGYIMSLETILVVDDDRDIVNTLKIQLEREGYQVFCAYNGLEALELLEHTQVHLVLMDVMMPRLDGFSACKEIRKIKNTPILMLSARTEEYDKLFGFEMGVDDYVVKPFLPKEVMARINAIIKRNAHKSTRIL